jgi:hypothetical protein
MEANQRPSLNGANGNGRDQRGRWAVGNRGGPGNPYSKRVNRLRAMLFRSCDPAKMQVAVNKALDQAMNGDTAILFELWDRLCGRVSDTEIRNRLDALIYELSNGADGVKLKRFAAELRDDLGPRNLVAGGE